MGMPALPLVVAAAALTPAALALLRRSDCAADRAEWRRLAALQPAAPVRFDLNMLEGLPILVQRFFAFAIAEGAPLLPVVELDMIGEFSMGSKADPKYMSMRARQILAAPHGFVWSMKTTHGAQRLPAAMAGSDTGLWTRFWLYGLIPVARLGGDADHRRAAFGRYVAESLFWSPAALLPSVAGDSVCWETLDENTIRVTVSHQGMEQAVEMEVEPSGQPRLVRFLRWSNANPQKRYRLQPFGGHLSRFAQFQGYTLPTHVEAGNAFGTHEYFPFFRADITAVTFPQPSASL